MSKCTYLGIFSGAFFSIFFAFAALVANFFFITKFIQFNFFRSKLKFLSFLRKRCNVNPARGPFHFRAPSRIFFRTVRGEWIFSPLFSIYNFFLLFILSWCSIPGMLPHKTYRGENALHHLKAYEGIPPAFTKRRRVVVPSAMSVLCLRPGRKVDWLKHIFYYYYSLTIQNV